MRDDHDYFYRRAEAELVMAERSTVPQAVQAHYMLSCLYLRYIYGDHPLVNSEEAPLFFRHAKDGAPGI